MSMITMRDLAALRSGAFVSNQTKYIISQRLFDDWISILVSKGLTREQATEAANRDYEVITPLRYSERLRR